MEYIYMAKIVHYSMDEQIELTDYVIIIAHTFTDAQDKICQYYGEDSLIATNISLVSPFDDVLQIPTEGIFLTLRDALVQGAIW